MRKTVLFTLLGTLFFGMWGLWAASCTDDARTVLPVRETETRQPELPDLVPGPDQRVPADLATPMDAADDGPSDARPADGGG